MWPARHSGTTCRKQGGWPRGYAAAARCLRVLDQKPVFCSSPFLGGPNPKARRAHLAKRIQRPTFRSGLGGSHRPPRRRLVQCGLPSCGKPSLRIPTYPRPGIVPPASQKAEGQKLKVNPREKLRKGCFPWGFLKLSLLGSKS